MKLVHLVGFIIEKLAYSFQVIKLKLCESLWGKFMGKNYGENLWGKFSHLTASDLLPK